MMKIELNQNLKGGFYCLDFITKLAVTRGYTIQYNYDKDNKKFYNVDKTRRKLDTNEG